MANEKISIVGIEGKNFDFDAVKNTVVKINGLYYKRNSPDLVRVRDKHGKLRFFRDKSPLIVKLPDGTAILKSQALLTEDGIWLDKNSEDVVEINGKYHRRQYCVKVNGQWYLRTSPDLVQECINGEYILKSDAVPLSRVFYPQKEKWALAPFVSYYKYKGEEHAVLTRDTRKLWSFTENKIVNCPNQILAKETYTNLVVDFQDKTNPQEDRVVTVHAISEECTDKNTTILNFTHPEIGDGIQYKVPTYLVDYFQHAIDTFITPRYMNKVEQIRNKIVANFSDMDENENTAKLFKIIPRPYPGKAEIYRPPTYPTPVKSKSFKNTGALRYSFGVEFETSQGLLNPSHCDDLDLFCVGDRSVGAGEYVTAPLSGDSGIARIEKICEVLSKYTLVDDRCGIHVHVGTLFRKTDKKPVPAPNEAPTFNRNFLINSIKLGALIEEELYQAMPKNRKPTLYHCHSIKRFGGINDKNFDTHLGAYIFGPKELWFLEDGTPIKPFDFTPYKLGANYNANHNVGTWAEGRYKWLNLIHSYVNGGHRTIEFRIFSATTVFEKVYAYILTALAFTYVADNCAAIIKPGITLSQVFSAAYPSAPDLVTFLDSFYAKRKAKFKRGSLYPTNHPYLKF